MLNLDVATMNELNVTCFDYAFSIYVTIRVDGFEGTVCCSLKIVGEGFWEGVWFSLVSLTILLL